MLSFSIGGNMSNNWARSAHILHSEIVGDKWKIGSDEDIKFLTLALVGEAGELANMIKKRWRGDTIPAKEINKELADIRIYLEVLADYLSCDLDKACRDKIEEVRGRYSLNPLNSNEISLDEVLEYKSRDMVK